MLSPSYHPFPLRPSNPTRITTNFTPRLVHLHMVGFQTAPTSGSYPRPILELRVFPDDTTEAPTKEWMPPRDVWRGLAAPLLAGQVFSRAITGRIHWKNTMDAVEKVGVGSTAVCLLTSALVGMAFSVQFIREFTRLGLSRSVGGVLALAFSRELSPVVTAVVVAGRVGSSFAAELGTMQVSEQTDTLRVLGSSPVDHLVTPRVLACCIVVPVLTLAGFAASMASSAFLAEGMFGVSVRVVMRSARRAVGPGDLAAALAKSVVFGGIVSVVSCAWGMTTEGGAKGVGESTTSAVVVSLVSVFAMDFLLSLCFFGCTGDSLRMCF